MKLGVKELVMLGFSVGIGLLFFGAIVSNVFPSSETSLVSYKASASIKLIGIGGVICTMLVAGIRLDGVDKNLKVLLLILGLVLLVVYTVGSTSLEWNLPSLNGGTQDSSGYSTRPTGYGIPGFEAWMTLGALAVVVLVLMSRRRRAV